MKLKKSKKKSTKKTAPRRAPTQAQRVKLRAQSVTSRVLAALGRLTPAAAAQLNHAGKRSLWLARKIDRELPKCATRAEEVQIKRRVRTAVNTAANRVGMAGAAIVKARPKK